MATRQRLRELAHADLERECAMFKRLNGDVVIRTASPEELSRYRMMAKKAKIQNKQREQGDVY